MGLYAPILDASLIRDFSDEVTRRLQLRLNLLVDEKLEFSLERRRIKVVKRPLNPLDVLTPPMTGPVLAAAYAAARRPRRVFAPQPPR